MEASTQRGRIHGYARILALALTLAVFLMAAMPGGAASAKESDLSKAEQEFLDKLEQETLDQRQDPAQADSDEIIDDGDFSDPSDDDGLPESDPTPTIHAIETLPSGSINTDPNFRHPLFELFLSGMPQFCREAIETNDERLYLPPNENGVPYWHPDHPGTDIDLEGTTGINGGFLGPGYIVIGTNNADHINGSDWPDVICAGGGNDHVWGNHGTDWIWGQGGRDHLFGGANQDVIFGGYDNDEITGDWGSDTLCGEAGDDTLLGGPNKDTISGGSGDDVIDYEGEGLFPGFHGEPVEPDPCPISSS